MKPEINLLKKHGDFIEEVAPFIKSFVDNPNNQGFIEKIKSKNWTDHSLINEKKQLAKDFFKTAEGKQIKDVSERWKMRNIGIGVLDGASLIIGGFYLGGEVFNIKTGKTQSIGFRSASAGLHSGFQRQLTVIFYDRSPMEMNGGNWGGMVDLNSATGLGLIQTQKFVPSGSMIAIHGGGGFSAGISAIFGQHSTY